MRDAFVRQITARGAAANQEEYGEESFGWLLGEFKKLFNRGTVPKQGNVVE